MGGAHEMAPIPPSVRRGPGEAVALLGIYAGSLNPCRASSFQPPSCFCQT